MILLIDNYDSFVYNLGRYFEILGHPILIYRHDKITLTEIETLKLSHIVISPGPGGPLKPAFPLMLSNTSPLIFLF